MPGHQSSFSATHSASDVPRCQQRPRCSLPHVPWLGRAAESRCSSSFLPRRRRRGSQAPGCSPRGCPCPCPRFAGGLRPASSEVPPTLCSICKKKPHVDRTLPSFSLLAGKERTSRTLAPAQSGHAGAPERIWQEGAPGSGGDGSTLGECVPVLQMECEVPSGDPRAESNGRSAARRRIPAPTRPGGGKVSPWLRSTAAGSAQRPDCLPAADVPLRAAAQRGFSALLNDRSMPLPSGRFRCGSPALARRPAAGNRPAAEHGPEKGLCVSDRSGLSRVRCKCQKGIGRRKPEGSAERK